jgi:Acyl-CoA carboxylase epsilon subunit
MSEASNSAANQDGSATEHIDIHIERGRPTDEEIAALVAVLGGAAGGTRPPTVIERNLWGHPVEKLRYAVFSWQRVTLLERTFMRR